MRGNYTSLSLFQLCVQALRTSIIINICIKTALCTPYYKFVVVKMN